jgi:hypothetical protein
MDCVPEKGGRIWGYPIANDRVLIDPTPNSILNSPHLFQPSLAPILHVEPHC